MSPYVTKSKSQLQGKELNQVPSSFPASGRHKHTQQIQALYHFSLLQQHSQVRLSAEGKQPASQSPKTA